MSVSTEDTMVIPTVGAKAFLTQMVAALQHLALATVGLFVNNYNPTVHTTAADLIEPNVGTEWAEYARKATTGWGIIGVGAQGEAYLQGAPVMQWVGPAIPFAQTVYGYFITSVQAGTPLLKAARFAQAVPILDANSLLTMIPTFTLPYSFTAQ